MILQQGDMWSAWPKSDHFLITTNGSINKSNQLVMGRGIASQAKEKYPGLSERLAQAIHDAHMYDAGHLAHVYGMLLGSKLGIFQVKYHWSDNASIDLITWSTALLEEHARNNPIARYDLNFPGIGNGYLPRSFVLPIISHLPNNVYIWELPKEPST